MQLLDVINSINLIQSSCSAVLASTSNWEAEGAVEGLKIRRRPKAATTDASHRRGQMVQTLASAFLISRCITHGLNGIFGYLSCHCSHNGSTPGENIDSEMCQETSEQGWTQVDDHCYEYG